MSGVQLEHGGAGALGCRRKVWLGEPAGALHTGFPSCASLRGVLVVLLSFIVSVLMTAPCLIINTSGWGPRFRKFPWSASKVDKATNGTCVCFATGHISKGGGPRSRLRAEWGGKTKDVVAGIPERAPTRQSLGPEDLPGGTRMILFHRLKADV